MGGKSSWFEIRCDKHGKSESGRPMQEKVLKVSAEDNKDPKHMGICPKCALENKNKNP